MNRQSSSGGLGTAISGLLGALSGRWRLRAAGLLSLAMVLAVVPACTTILVRSPVPEDQINSAAPYGIKTAVFRVWGDSLSKEVAEAIAEDWAQTIRRGKAAEIAAGGPVSEVTLALSGGGPDGAFSAGLLNGWTKRGDRPDFTLVTGISTGAIVALFAFLGPDYDTVLTEIYTTYTTDQLLTRTIFSALTGGSAIVSTSGYRRLIEKYIDDAVVERLAAEHRRGRDLLIGTTNLDAARPVVWSIGRIAATGHPSAKTLIQDIIQASSAIPAAFPPVIIPVETADGRRFDEMHVDGGATQQVMFFNPAFPLQLIDKELGVKFNRSVYVVINNKLIKPYNPVSPRLVSIAGAAAGSLLSGAGTGDVYKIFAIAQRDDIDMKVLSIPDDFEPEPAEPFDPVYMKALYDLGYEKGLAGDSWQSQPPGFAVWP